ncbi:MAG: GNAT family N-acetyltransferase [Muribaculaceae bacterium]|nr:GNAT family N-acetyltransferase [Muribaculaceae bacterium]MDE6692681.1 GNAT family N-acetyltransferase [Muribaculaceae bacterium]
MAQDIRVRAIEPTDIDFLYRIENIPQVWNISWGDAPVSRQLLWDYINSYTADIYRDRQLRLIIETEGKPVGTVDISDYDPRNGRALIGVAVDASYQNKGIATKALEQVIERCRDTFGMHQLAALILKDNEASLHLFDKLGFKTSGCLKSWHKRGGSYVDTVIMQLML